MTDRECESRRCARTGFGVAPRPELDGDSYCLSCFWERTNTVSLLHNAPGEATSLPEFTDWSRV